MTVTRADLEADRVRARLAESEIAGQLLTDSQLDASLQSFLAGHRGGNLWLFAYGSLMWNPTVEYIERRPATLHGYHRQFCLWSRVNRGTPKHPGLVLGLARGGSCHGVALSLAEDRTAAELRLLWRREMITGAYDPRWVRLRLGSESAPALAFVVRPDASAYCGRLPDDVVVDHMLRAHGFYGSAADYLADTASALSRLGVRDRYVARLMRQLNRRRQSAG